MAESICAAAVKVTSRMGSVHLCLTESLLLYVPWISIRLDFAVNEVSRGRRFIPQRRRLLAFLYETFWGVPRSQI